MDARPAAPPPLPAPAAGYRPLPGVADEMVAPDGSLRPVWRPFLDHLAAIAPEELRQRIHRGELYLRDQGMFLRLYGAEGLAERAWPFSPVPVIVDRAEWEGVVRGLIQRAELLEAVMADLYGPGRLVADGHLPAALIAANPEWLRPMVGIRPRGGHFLHLVAFDIGRGPDGGWWVLGDRTQAPSGAGYALENRVAAARVFPEFHAAAGVARLAGFFDALRAAFAALAGPGGGRAGILTPGPLTETYVEHAFLARSLGLMLLQGEDLAAEAGRLMLRSVAGPRPVGVLWRRLDSTYADPLELDPDSRLGVPGLVSVLRQGGACVVNPPGAGVLETRALLAFLPALARRLLGEPLILPNVATWWLGGAAERAHVAAHPDRMVLSPALSTLQPFEGVAPPAPPPGRTLAEWLAAEGAGLVAQEAVTLSTTPALEGGRLAPRPMSLRAFLLRTPGGWTAMPGGFARIGRGSDPGAVAMRRGAAAADVWILGPPAVASAPAAAAAAGPPGPAPGPWRRPEGGDLTARAADNLFWLGRYVARVEDILRLLRALNGRLAENGGRATALTAAAAAHLASYGADAAQGIPRGLIETLAAAKAAAGQVRDRFSPDGWSALADLDRTMRRMAERVAPGDDAARAAGALLRKISGFAGLVHENMYRAKGWRFLELGRHHERAAGMAGLLAAFADPAAPDGALDLAVEVGDSLLTHRRRFALQATRASVVDLLGLDARNPRAIRFQIDGIEAHVARLPGAGAATGLAAAAAELRAGLEADRPETLSTARLAAIRAAVARLSDLVGETWLS